MSKPFDATLNAMIDVRPGQWADCFARVAGLPPGPSTPVDTDLATTLQADKVFRIDGPRPYLLHLELEANPRLGIPAELLRYNTLIAHQHDLPVETVLVLLRPKALASDQTGVFRRVGVTGAVITEFRYHVERAWERPADYWLVAGPGLAPLAVVTDEATENLEGMVAHVREHLDATGTAETVARRLIIATYFLCGLRHSPDAIENIFRRLNMLMEASSTYQATIQKGRVEALQGTLKRVGERKFRSPPDAATIAALQAITDLGRLERLTDRLLDANSWADLLAE